MVFGRSQSPRITLDRLLLPEADFPPLRCLRCTSFLHVASEPMMISAWTLVVYALYLAGLIAFGVFYGMEEGTTKAYLGIFAVIVVVALLGVMQRLFFVGATVAATFYVVDRKNRSRGWAIPA